HISSKLQSTAPSLPTANCVLTANCPLPAAHCHIPLPHSRIFSYINPPNQITAMKSRRDFLQKISATALAVPFLSSAKAAGSSFYEEPYEGPVLKVAILGLGSYGTRVAEAMRDCKAAKLTGVISGTPSKIADWQKKYGIPAANCYNYE